MLSNETELTNTRQKLAELESLYEQHDRNCDEDSRVRELSMHSLRRLINQLKEEIAWFEAQQHAQR